MSETKPKICIIAYNAYGAISGRKGHVGGAEHQTASMARWLAARGYQTSLITWDEGQPDMQVHDGVTVVKVCKPGAGLPVLRFFHPRMTGLFSAMGRADADVYYHNSAEYVTGLAAWWCRNNGRKFVYSVASDVACETKLPALKEARERVLYRYGLRHAHKIIVQTDRQRGLLRESFGLDSVVLPMPCYARATDDPAMLVPPVQPRVAWVGRIDHMKRMEWLLDIAERLPQVKVELVAANMDITKHYSHLADYAKGLYERAKSIPNVEWHGTLSRDQVAAIYKRSTCLCCTSVYEGFPNTFLESWSQGRPVVSSFDPDRVIQRLKLGTFASNVDEFVAAIRQLAESREAWLQQSRNSLEYYSTNHESEVALPRFERELVNIWRGDRAASPHAAPASEARS